MPPPEMTQAHCTKQLCSFCHRGLAQRLSVSSTSGARYARPTNSSLRRAMASTSISNHPGRARQKIASDSKIPVKTGSSRLFDIPAELRVQIYAFCMAAKSGFSSRALCGWIEGGGYHPEYHAREWLTENHLQQHQPFYLWADRHFPVSLLLTCKLIYREALPEIYRRIHFQVTSSRISELNLVHYWLTKHPLRFTASLEIPFIINLFPPPLQKRDKLSQGEIKRLSVMLARMPYLNNLNLLAGLDSPIDRQFCSENNLLKAGAILKSRFSGLTALRRAVPPNVQTSITAIWMAQDRFGSRLESGKTLGNTCAVEDFCAAHSIIIARRGWVGTEGWEI